MLMRAHADAAAQMAHDQVHVLISLAQLLGRPAPHSLVVQRVELAQAAELGKAGVVGHLRHLVHAHRVNEERRDAHHVAQLLGQIRAQIGRMLAVGRGLHVGHDLVVHGIRTAGDGPVQPAPPAHGGEVAQLIARLGDGLQNGLLAVVRLVDDPGELIQLLGGVVDRDLEKLLLVLEHRDLGGRSAGVDDQKFHTFLLPVVPAKGLGSLIISPNGSMNYFNYGTPPPRCQRRFAFPRQTWHIAQKSTAKPVQNTVRPL